MLGGLVGAGAYQPVLALEGVREEPKVDIDKIVDEINRKLGDRKNPVITRGSMGNRRLGGAWRMKSGHRSPAYTTSWSQLPVVGLGKSGAKRS
jgi:hypothetical protein